MDRKDIDSRHIVARYLADQLTDSERQAFETYYVEHPEILQDMEAVAQLKLGLQHLHKRHELDALTRGRRWLIAPRFLAAAAVLLASVALVLFLLRGPSRQPLLAATSGELHTWRGETLPIASTHMLLRTRGSGPDAQIVIGASSESVELLVMPEHDAHPQIYRLALASLDDQGRVTVVAELQGLPRTQEPLPVDCLRRCRVPDAGNPQHVRTECDPRPLSLSIAFALRGLVRQRMQRSVMLPPGRSVRARS
jgi:hypothetical protein